MLFKIKKFKFSQYFQNIAIVLTGGFIAQTIPLFVSPIISRIYSPSDFGLFAIIYGIASFFGVFSMGKFDGAIYLTNDIVKIRKIINLCLKLLIISLAILLVLIVSFSKRIANIFEIQDNSSSLYFVPLITFLTSIYLILNTVLIKEKKFRVNSSNKVLQSSFNAGIQLLYSLFRVNYVGLILGQVSSLAIASTNIVLRGNILKKYFYNNKASNFELKKIFTEYKKFFVYDVPSNLFNFASSQIPIFTFSIIFDLKILGAYAFANKILLMPVNLLSKSVVEVFKNQSSEDYLNTGNCRKVYKQTFNTLFLLGIVPFSLLFFFGSDLFVWVFGQNWVEAGRIVEIIAPAVFFKLVSSPLTYTFYLAGKQNYDALMQGIYFFLTILIIWFSYYNKNLENTMILISILNSILYIIYLFFSFKFTKNENTKISN